MGKSRKHDDSYDDDEDDGLPFFSEERAYNQALKDYKDGKRPYPTSYSYSFLRKKTSYSKRAYDPTGRMSRLAREFLG